MHDKFTVPMFY